ncbi:MAG: DegT/DnrJ/EryC1/StrS family aminotransferase [Spirochaetota bacterium]
MGLSEQSQRRTVSVGDFIIGDIERDAVLEVLNSNRISEHVKTFEFERKFAKYIGTKTGVAVNSGTSALVLASLTLQYSGRYPKAVRGKKVIVPALGYVATSNAQVLTGFEPIFVDVDPVDLVCTPGHIEAAIQEHGADNIAGIVPVHLMGYPADMDAINEIARQCSLFVVEDAAQAHGTKYHGHVVGSLSDMSVYSFYIAHNIQAGEMGALMTNDDGFARLARQLKANGRMCDCNVCTRRQGVCPHRDPDPNSDNDPRFMHSYISFNFKTMDLQTALALTQLARADEIFDTRLKNVSYLNNGLSFLEPVIRLPRFSAEVSYLAYPLVVKDTSIVSRKTVRDHLEKNGIESRPLFGSVPTQQPAYAAYRDRYKGKVPDSDYIGENGFYIGCHQYLKQDDLDHVVDVFRKLSNNGRWQ